MSGYRIREALRGLAVLLFLAAFILLALRILAGCTPAEQQQAAMSAENAAAVAQYDAALVECQQAARQAPKLARFEAYVSCEMRVSQRLCRESPELQREWKRCAELELDQ
jgi:hypothetical protein